MSLTMVVCSFRKEGWEVEEKEKEKEKEYSANTEND